MATWGYIKQESEFFEIFGSDSVPLRSIVPIVPREKSAPPCYVILGDRLPTRTLELLAHKLYKKWHPECSTMQEAIEYIKQGLPLRTDHFDGVSDDSYASAVYGAALNIAIRSDYKQNQN